MASRRNWKLGSSKNNSMTSKRPKRKEQTLLNLPSDLLLVIISRLPLKDNIRASTVSKTLHEACVSVRVAETSPWLIYFSEINNGSCELYDPSMQKTYNLEFPEIAGFHVCYSKDGWLLMYNPDTDQLRFFNPFTRDHIPLPSLRMEYNQLMAFSCAPTSTSCLLFTINVVLRLSFDTITVKTCSPNAKEWTSHVFKERRLPIKFQNFQQIVFANGVFFCLSGSGHFSIFCPSLKNWKVLPGQPQRDWESYEYFMTENWKVLPGRPQKDSESYKCFMTEHQGKMFLLYFYNYKCPTLVKFNDTTLEWTRVKTLGGLTIYVSALSSEMRAEQNQPSGRKNCLCHGFKRPCVYHKMHKVRQRFFKWNKHDQYADIWIAPPLNLLDLPFV